MKRRTYIGTASSLLAIGGCVSRGRDSSNSKNGPPKVESRSVEITDRRCVKNDEQSHDTTISVGDDENRIKIEGAIAVHKPCLDLAIVPIRNAMEDGKVTANLDIDIDIVGPDDMDCKTCPSEIDYEAIVRFSHLPNELGVYHIERNFEEEKTIRVGPIAKRSF
jgi:hypothetical protein